MSDIQVDAENRILYSMEERHQENVFYFQANFFPPS